MIWLPIVILVGVVLCVGGLFFGMKLQGKDPGVDGLMLLAVGLYGTSFTAGWFFTYFSSPDASDWWQMIALRAVWTIAGVILVSIVCYTAARGAGNLGRPVYVLIAVLALFGLFTARSCILDLIEGPVLLQVTGFDVQNVHNTARGGAKIFATLETKGPDGSAQTIDLAGWNATLAQDALAHCNADDAPDLLVLEHMNKVLGVDCRAASASSLPHARP